MEKVPSYKSLVRIIYMNGTVLELKDLRGPKEALNWFSNGMRGKTPMVEYTYDDGGGQLISLANVMRITVDHPRKVQR
ncbi:hypothetical protein HUN41_00281 [Streptomyces phage Coruscant]|uniref:Uncharacterized protein n=1 Tax=Streptomyces phage Coruscant TaxID=2739834 RepID=A0A7G4AVV5_9CAUD|nr:hypothetical protein PP454_gp015 [Streptomyces phage Coruscant]YP_010651604.1 hypothetical protein PP454_gp048 [Streptomyces phage Coruscant]QMP84145.1 hypothetical protein HUN41_00015 [Streptomyces phage Coruscant]QMP84369.1 hypothetical protein HUN41_00281 [Streptomyces phage Coruscant]